MDNPILSEEETKELPEIIADLPPGKEYRVENLFSHGSRQDRSNAAVKFRRIVFPLVKLYCNNEHCGDYRFFESNKANLEVPDGIQPNSYDAQVDYICRHCRASKRHFAFFIKWHRNEDSFGHITKMGEIPAFGPHTPARLLKLLGPDGELFLKGRRAEILGLGIGAAAYYRRVVENQKNRLLDELIKASTRIGASKEILDDLERAKSDFQFSKAINSFKPAVPDGLLLRGHNPLTLLHSALSGGIHVESDAECLEFAQIVRTILSELAERMAVALADQRELDHALSRLVDKNNGKKCSEKAPSESADG